MMKSKVISMPLIIENFKRFWGFAAASFMVLFLSGPFIVLSRAGRELSSGTVRGIVTIANPGYIMVAMIAPVIASLCVFSYLHKVNSVSLVHSMPFSRLTLYVSNLVSGLVLIIIPVILNGICLFAVKRPVYSYYWEDDKLVQDVDVFTSKAILTGIFTILVIELFTYAISCLAAMVSGNAVIHMLTAYGFNVIVPLFILTLTGWAEHYFYGYCASDGLIDAMGRMHPAVSLLVNGRSNLTAAAGMIYLAVAVAVAVFAYFVYRKRPLEKATESYVFDTVTCIIGFLLTYLPAVGAAFVLEGEIGFVLGVIVGAVLGFVIGSMIIDKSFRIFDLEHLKRLAVYGLLIFAIIAVFLFDLTGYETRVPRIENIESAEINPVVFNNNYPADFKEAENLQNVIDVHKVCIDNPSEYEPNVSRGFVRLCYCLKNGKKMQREYLMDTELLRSCAGIRNLAESDEYRSKWNGLLKFDPDITEVTVSENLDEKYGYATAEYEYTGGSPWYLAAGEDPKLAEAITEALYKDLTNAGLDDLTDKNVHWATISLSQHIDCTGTIEDTAVYGANGREIQAGYERDKYGDICGCTVYTDISISSYMTNTIEVLKANMDYYSLFPKEEDGFMAITECDTEEDLQREADAYGDVYYGPTAAVYPIEGDHSLYDKLSKVHTAPESEDGCVIVSDSALQCELIENCCKYDMYPYNPETQLFISLWQYSGAAGESCVRVHRWYLDESRLPAEVKTLIAEYIK